MVLTQCFQNLFEHEIFFSRKTCLTDFRNVWSESTSVIGITYPCVQTVAPNAGLCTLSSYRLEENIATESSVGRAGVLRGAMRCRLLTNTRVSLCLLYTATMKHHSQKQLGKERVHLAYESLSQFITEETQGRTDGHGRSLLTDLLLWLAPPQTPCTTLLYNPGPILQGWHGSQQTAPPRSILNQENAPIDLLKGHSTRDSSSIEIPSFQICSGLC